MELKPETRRKKNKVSGNETVHPNNPWIREIREIHVSTEGLG